MLGLAGTSALLFLSAFVGLLFFLKCCLWAPFLELGRWHLVGGGGLSRQHSITASSWRRGASISPSLSHPIPKHPPLGNVSSSVWGAPARKKMSLPPQTPRAPQPEMLHGDAVPKNVPGAAGVHEDRRPTVGPGGRIWAVVQPFMGKSPPPLRIPGEKRVMFGAVRPGSCWDGSFLSHLSSQLGKPQQHGSRWPHPTTAMVRQEGGSAARHGWGRIGWGIGSRGRR